MTQDKLYSEEIACVGSEEELDFLESLSEENDFSPITILSGEVIA